MKLHGHALRRGIPILATLSITMAGCGAQDSGSEGIVGPDTLTRDTGRSDIGRTRDVSADPIADSSDDVESDTGDTELDGTELDGTIADADVTPRPDVADTASDVSTDTEPDVTADTNDTGPDVDTDTGGVSAEELEALRAALDAFFVSYCEGASGCATYFDYYYSSEAECLSTNRAAIPENMGQIEGFGIDCVTATIDIAQCLRERSACFEYGYGGVVYFGVDDGSCDSQAALRDASCTEQDFICGDGYPIPPSWVCDDFADCDDASDEADCF